MSKRKTSKDHLLELIAPNGKPIGDCTGDEITQFADFYAWLMTARDDFLLCIEDGPTKGRDTPEMVQVMFAVWRDRLPKATHEIAEMMQ